MPKYYSKNVLFVNISDREMKAGTKTLFGDKSVAVPRLPAAPSLPSIPVKPTVGDGSAVA